MIEGLLYIAFVFFIYKLLKKIGTSIPIFELTAVLYLLQYGVTAVLEYQYGERGSMAVAQEVYLPYAVLGSLAFIAGLLFFKPKFDFSNLNIAPAFASSLGRIFIIIGLAATVSTVILPDALRSIINFFIILKWPGVFSLVFSHKKLDRLLIGIVFFETAFSAILNALLIEFLVLSLFLAIYLSLRYKFSTKLKIIGVVSGLMFITLYQGVKADYRDVVWEEELSFTEKTALLTELLSPETITEAFSFDIARNESALSTIHRLNQGWQTSKVMYQVPNVVPFEEGKALRDDLLSSIAPRFLFPNKRVVNDYERFNYYTGYSLNKSTAMTIGVLGDFYINFGVYIGIVFLFLFGMLFSRIAYWFYKQFIYVNHINIIWLPFLFSYLIRPGNEFYMVFNHLVKGLIIFFVVSKLVYPYIEKKLVQKQFEKTR